ncbi:UPF0182 family protein [Gleimia sp. 6138-11-ORH1]|uniref:UPF0182 family membrane protein n=1 Tax=Gleimia sp. 6138-11-ORH1 TaxID=2973937 RepID=UPI0037BFA954
MSGFGGFSGGSGNGGGSGKGRSSGGQREPINLRELFTPLRITIFSLFLLGGIFFLLSDFITEVLWYNQVGAQEVFWTRWILIVVLVLFGTIINGSVVALVMQLAYRARPSVNSAQFNPQMREYQKQIEPLRKVIFLAVPLFIGFTTGTALASDWSQLLAWWYATPFGNVDAQWGLDISFYVFTVPVLELFVALLMRVIGFSLLAAIVVNYLYSGISLFPRFSVSAAARRQIGILAALLSLVVAARYWLVRYQLLSTQGERFDGALYTQINAQIPAQTILTAISILVALLFVVAAFRGSWQIPAAGVAVTVVSALVVGLAYPTLVQEFQVKPNERAMESPYIQRNIDATLEAFGIADVEMQTYSAKTETTPGQLRDDAASTQQIRLIDPDVISPTVRQLKQSRSYYTFPSQLSVDRYEINGVKRDTVIAVRELNLEGLDENERNWVNEHTIFTHGYGVVAAYGNKVDSKGEPSWWEEGIPSKGDIGEYEQRVYFSPSSPEYSIVGAPEGAKPLELDYPDESADGQVPTTFTGNGGPYVGSFVNKLLYAIKFKSTNIFFASQINEKSQILYDRDPSLRVRKVAPYLELDQNPYPAVVDMDGDPATPKRLVWIIDAYTTTNNYPYAQTMNLWVDTADSKTGRERAYSSINDLNYMRNSVKAVVDAYDGSVKLYQWDKTDPIINTWMKIFPQQVLPLEEISGDLMAHMRYPQDLFKLQRNLLAAYHVNKADNFYTGGDRWRLSEDPTSKKSSTQAPVQPPYYLTMQMPGQETAEFSLTSVFVPGGKSDREPMAGFLAVDSETGSEPGKIREGYGKLRLLALPSSTTVPGPGQVQNNFNANSEIGRELNLLDQQGSELILGNLLTLPVGGGLLYVQPVYLQGTGSTKYPVLRKVLTAFGDSVGFADTLEASLDQTFKGNSAAQLAEGEAGKETGGTDKPQTEGETKPSESVQVNKLLQEARQAMLDSEKALQSGDWGTYGEKQKLLKQKLEEAIKLDSGN